MLAQQAFAIRPLPQIVFAAGASLKLADHVKAVGCRSALVVTDGALMAAGVPDAAIAALRAAGVAVEVFAGGEANPTDRNVEAGARMLRDMEQACVVAFGGGSSMDCGKAIALLGRNAETVEALQAAPPSHPGAPGRAAGYSLPAGSAAMVRWSSWTTAAAR